jgi:hypothetical protein
MSSVTVPTTLGGSGIAYSDDGSGARDMRNGGHRDWLLPMVGEAIEAVGTAVEAAGSIVGAASTQASSTTSLAIGTGTKNLDVQTGKNIIAGMPVRIASTATPTNRMDGTVTSYDSGTGALVVSVDRVIGSGTEASWRVFLTGAGISTADIAGGAGSASITTSTALVAASERVRPVAMSSDFQSVTLPDATTLAEGGPYPVLPNIGTRPFSIRDSTGVFLGAVPPGGVAECYLRDNSTAAGAWSIGGRDVREMMVVGDFTLASTQTQAVETVVRLSDTRAFMFSRNSSGHPSVTFVDSTPGSPAIGAAALIVASSATVAHAFRISDTKAAVIVDGTSSNIYHVTVDPVTRVCTVSSAATAAVFDAATFTDNPLICALGANNDLLVALDSTGTTIRAQAVDCSGSSPSAGSSANVSALGTGSVVPLAIFRESDTRAAAFYIDDSGSAGTPFSIRGVVLTLTGTSIAVGTSQGVNDVVLATTLPICQHAAGLYTIGYYSASGTLLRAVGVTIATATVTFGSPFTVETVSLGSQAYTNFNANRFQPNLYAIDATRALFTYGHTSGSTLSRHVVLTNTAGAITAPGQPLYGLWTDQDGGNFPQAADGFLAVQEQSTSSRISNVTISGNTLAVTGTALPPGVSFSESVGNRFGLSGGVRAIRQAYQNGPAISAASVWNAFRVSQGAGPRYLGPFDLPNFNGAQIPIELASNKAAFTSGSLSQTGGTSAAIKIAIVEFAPP